MKLSFNSFKKGTYKVICYNRDGLSKTNTVKVYNIASTKLAVNVPNTYTILPYFQMATRMSKSSFQQNWVEIQMLESPSKSKSMIRHITETLIKTV